MFEFEYDNFLDKYNGLKIVVRNTADGRIVGYAMNNDGVVCYDYCTDYYTQGCDFIISVTYALERTINRAINNKADFEAINNEADSEYRSMKKEEVKELMKKQAEQFLLDYFQVEDMRDLLVRDEFFDKKMFVES